MIWLLVLLLVGTTGAALEDNECPFPPYVAPLKNWSPSSIRLDEIPTKDVVSYVLHNSSCTSADADAAAITILGHMPQFRRQDALEVLDHAVNAWQGGTGLWTSGYSLGDRIAAVRRFLTQLPQDEIAQVLQYEIGKNYDDALSEVTRTLAFCEQVIEELLEDPLFHGGAWKNVQGKVHALTKQMAIGVVLALAPYNYPLNECYAAIIPALLLGNVVIIKIPTTGGLAHLRTLEAAATELPPGVLSFVSGGGRSTMPPIMETGKVDALAFIGGSAAADALIHAHPHPHRLKSFLQLEAKNMGIVLTDVFGDDDESLLQHTVHELVSGSLSFNGQRCTAIKLIFVPAEHADVLIGTLLPAVERLTVGLPWEKHGDGKYSKITPLPNPARVSYMQELLEDALSKGAKIVNPGGGEMLSTTLMRPAVVYPVTPNMRLYAEEQFGPIVPIASYESLDTVIAYGRDGDYAQQVSIFGQDAASTSRLVDAFGAIFGKINLNAACGRSPDTLAFSGRRSSALGTMSVRGALLEFSVPTVIAYKDGDKTRVANQGLVEGLDSESVFLAKDRVHLQAE